MLILTNDDATGGTVLHVQVTGGRDSVLKTDEEFKVDLQPGQKLEVTARKAYPAARAPSFIPNAGQGPAVSPQPAKVQDPEPPTPPAPTDLAPVPAAADPVAPESDPSTSPFVDGATAAGGGVSS